MNRTILFSVITIFVITFCSCGSDSNKGIEISYDDVAGYASHPTLVTESAHSGKKCLRTDSSNPYGLTFKMKLVDISDKPVEKISIRVWVKTMDIKTSASIVCAVDSDAKNIFRNGTSIKDYISKANDWTEIRFEINLPFFNGPDYTLVIYPYNEGKETVWFDDLSISVAN